ncbi:hypothetical protein FRC09_012481 [Ceratobasidium sp. 395]|nr:hypothetical protein FRC09_012481 [Ceratobasidium sp. 395]
MPPNNMNKKTPNTVAQPQAPPSVAFKLEDEEDEAVVSKNSKKHKLVVPESDIETEIHCLQVSLTLKNTSSPGLPLPVPSIDPKVNATEELQEEPVQPAKKAQGALSGAATKSTLAKSNVKKFMQKQTTKATTAQPASNQPALSGESALPEPKGATGNHGTATVPDKASASKNPLLTKKTNNSAPASKSASAKDASAAQPVIPTASSNSATQSTAPAKKNNQVAAALNASIIPDVPAAQGTCNPKGRKKLPMRPQHPETPEIEAEDGITRTAKEELIDETEQTVMCRTNPPRNKGNKLH